MPKKSRGPGGKYAAKKKKKRYVPPPSQAGPAVSPQQEVASPTEGAAAPSLARPSPAKASLTPAASAAQYAYVTSELKRIAILAGAIILILVILLFAVPH